MEGQKKAFEAEIKTLKQEMSHEIESLTEMFSTSSRDLINLTFEHRALQKKLTDYSEKTERYTKELEQKVEEKTSELARITEEFATFDTRYAEKKKEAEALKKSIKDLQKEFDDLQNHSKRQQAVIDDYDERYKGIDISKMHEEIESLKTKCHAAVVNEQAVLQDLFKVRDRMMALAKRYDDRKAEEFAKMRANPRTYNGPAKDYSDPNKADALRDHEKQMKAAGGWRGEEDIELICQMFMDFLTTPTAITAMNLELSRQATGEKINIPSNMLNRDVAAEDDADKQLARARTILKDA